MITVLVIDDDPESRARVRKAAPADWQVLEAPDGIIGLDLARQNPGQIGLVVLDVELPEMEGRVVCLRLRDISPSVPILPYTGYDNTVHVLAEFACRRPVLKTDSDAELTQAMIAAVQEPPLPFAPSPTVRWMQATGQRFEDLVRKQRVGMRVAVYAASEYHRGALMHLLPVGIYGLDAAQLSAIETILHGMEILALVAHADDYAGVVPLATEYRVPLILVAADQAQALAVRVANVATVLLASDSQIEHHLARALEQLALGLPPEQPEFTAPPRQSTLTRGVR